MNDARVDLHMHSTCSDGTNSPQEIVAKAVDAGLFGISITDHDTLAAYPEALDEAKKCNLQMISGIELSCELLGETVHILGYAFDTQNQKLLDACSWQRRMRIERNRLMLEKLKKRGMLLEESEIADASHPTYAYGRVHIALAMVKRGYVKTVADAFKRYLGNNKSCYVQGVKWSVEEGIALVHEARGKVVLAHPHIIESKKVLRALQEMPFDGLEAYYGRFHKEENEKWAKFAATKGWFVTGGSDFHGAVKPDILLGCSYTPIEVFSMLKEHFDGL